VGRRQSDQLCGPGRYFQKSAFYSISIENGRQNTQVFLRMYKECIESWKYARNSDIWMWEFWVQILDIRTHAVYILPRYTTHKLSHPTHRCADLRLNGDIFPHPTYRKYSSHPTCIFSHPTFTFSHPTYHTYRCAHILTPYIPHIFSHPI